MEGGARARERRLRSKVQLHRAGGVKFFSPLPNPVLPTCAQALILSGLDVANDVSTAMVQARQMGWIQQLRALYQQLVGQPSNGSLGGAPASLQSPIFGIGPKPK